jgi:hypothetical protein
VAFQAARQVHLDSPKYGVDDDTTAQLVHTYEMQFKEAEAEYDFYCTQSGTDLNQIAAAVKKKEAVAVQNAAQAGLISAEETIKQTRLMATKAQKAAEERKAKDEKASKLRSKVAQEKTDKIASEAIQKNTARLARLPQITRTFMGEVLDASTTKAINDAKIKTVCLFSSHKDKSRNSGKFTVLDGITGPTGRQCEVEVSKDGYTSSKFPMTVMKGNTDSVFRHVGLLPKIADPKKFRFVVQHSKGPSNLDAHVLVPMPGEKYLDVGEHPLMPDQDSLKFGNKGAGATLPFATLDSSSAGFGVETVSVHNVNDGVYHFMVSNAAQSITTPRKFHSSAARAFLYQGNKLLNTVAIDSAISTPTHLWSVYTLSCKGGVCQLKVQNEFLSKVL